MENQHNARENGKSLFRRNTIDRISSPEQLQDYLSVTNPGTWVILAAVILLLLGIFAWSFVGTIETKTPVAVVVNDHNAQIISLENAKLEEGMPLRVSYVDSVIASAGMDEYGRSVGVAEVSLPDGTYDGEVTVEKIHPIAFLMESR